MKKTAIAAFGLVIWLIVLSAIVVRAGSLGKYVVEWWVISDGGAPAASGSGEIALNGSLGQTAIGDSTSAGGDYALAAGYWSARGSYGPHEEWRVYIPIVLRGF